MRAPAIGVAMLALLATAGLAEAGPRYVAGFGGAILSSDAPKKSGVSFSAAALWPLLARLEFGPMLFADDFGSEVGRLLDPNDGTDLGAVARRHRQAYGGAWRADAPFVLGPDWTGFVGATWGVYRIHDDRLGTVQRAISATGASVAAGVGRPLGGNMGVGVCLRYHQLFDDRQDHYASATVDFSWRSAGESGSRPGAAAPTDSEN